MKKIKLIFLVFLLFNSTSCLKTEEVSPAKKEEISKEEKPTYVDENPIHMGIYEKGSSSRNLVKTYTSDWILNKDILVLTSFPIQKEQIELGSVMDVFPKYWNLYENINSYKLGYILEFKMDSGEEVQKVIKNPEDTKEIYNYMQVYLYDDIHQKRGAWYSHVEEMKEDTLLTTIKLTGSFTTNQIKSPMHLSVFTYDGEEDFDEKGMYRGNSIYKIELIKKNTQ